MGEDPRDARLNETQTTEQEASAPVWTADQQRVIDARGKSLLVSAAAGSGKTAVLVARILTLITQGEAPLDVDELLVVTYTNAAAAEMRERLLSAIEREADARPTDAHLQRQRTLLHNAQITTIDSFCLHVVSNHFHRIGIEPGFRIADEAEGKLLMEEVCEAVLEEAYAEKDPAFLRFADGYASAKSDAPIREMIRDLYLFSQSYPWPDEWLAVCAAQYDAADPAALEEKEWVKAFLSYLRVRAGEMAARCEENLALTGEPDGPALYAQVARDDLAQIAALTSFEHLSDWQDALGAIAWTRLPRSAGEDADEEKKERFKASRQWVKDQIDKLKKKEFATDLADQTSDLRATGAMVESLVALTRAFAARFAKEKERRGIVDFSDLEHFALRILVDPDTKEPTETAGEYRAQFREVMIDEYQDSNYLQEAILTAVSGIPAGRENLFMVGDVKQSIYRFRLARPELFMAKFESFSLEEEPTQRIDLHQNFRSTPEVIGTVNALFSRIMDRDLGNITYDAAAALYLGRDCGEDAVRRSECLVIEPADGEDRKVTEAGALARRIRRLIEEEMPQHTYRDVVILLRSLKGWTQAFVTAFEREGVPLLVSSQTGYFAAREVQVILSMLRVLDNPRQDIPLAALMRSPIGGFTDEQMARIKARDGTAPFYACVLEAAGEDPSPLDEADPCDAEDLREKTAAFLSMLDNFRARVPYTPIHTLIREIYDETGYRDFAAALPAGEQRRANLDMLLEKAAAYEKTSYHGLYHFVRYIDRMIRYDLDLGEAETVSEQENAVRLMTIHKSKGLEFPIVVAAGMGRQINRMDSTASMVFHPTYGIGIKYCDPERRVKKDTLIRRAFAVEAQKESLGEELRVLYVALTRAKEKLLISGIRPDGCETAGRGGAADAKLAFSARMDAKTPFHWILPALADDPSVETRIVDPAEESGERAARQVRSALRREEILSFLRTVDEEALAALDARFSWEYPYPQTGVKQKLSVSEIKHRAMDEAREIAQEEEAQALFPEENPVPYIPRFVKEREENQGALRGTAFHRLMERLDFSAIPCFHRESEAQAWVADEVAALCADGRMDPDEADRIDPAQIARFFMTDAAAAMREAARRGTLCREQPFVMSVSAARVAEGSKAADGSVSAKTAGSDEDAVLIQGIIDAFWEEEDGIVLLDYKTDRVASAEELLARYRAQLALYAEALERRFWPKRVKGILLYSFCLDEMIPERRSER